MKAKVFLILTFLIAICLPAEETIKVGVFLHSPYVEKGTTEKEAQGAGIEYVTDVLKELGYSPEFMVMPFPRVIASLESGEVDMAFDLAKNPSREAFAYFADKPAMTVLPALVFRSDTKLTAITSVNDLKGMTIGYLTGSTVPRFLDVPNVFKFDTMSGEDWVKQNLAKLLSKRFDAVLDLNPYSYAMEAKKAGVRDQIKVLPLPGEGTTFYIVFSKKSKYGASLLAGYNELVTKNKFEYKDYIENKLK